MPITIIIERLYDYRCDNCGESAAIINLSNLHFCNKCWWEVSEEVEALIKEKK